MIFNLDTLQYLARSPRTALTPGDRLRGLIGRSFSPGFDGLIFPNCDAVHTFFMSMPIDVLFLDREGVAVYLRSRLRPWRPLVACRRAFTVVELPAGVLESSGTQVGHRINLNYTLSRETVAKLRRGDILSCKGQ